ncbi:MAG: hypothetical protein AAF517_04620 [Planctomycetota bacterium]
MTQNRLLSFAFCLVVTLSVSSLLADVSFHLTAGTVLQDETPDGEGDHRLYGGVRARADWTESRDPTAVSGGIRVAGDCRIVGFNLNQTMIQETEPVRFQRVEIVDEGRGLVFISTRLDDTRRDLVNVAVAGDSDDCRTCRAEFTSELLLDGEPVPLSFTWDDGETETPGQPTESVEFEACAPRTATTLSFSEPRSFGGGTELGCLLRVSEGLRAEPISYAIVVAPTGNCSITGATIYGTEGAHVDTGGRRDGGLSYQFVHETSGGGVYAGVVLSSIRPVSLPASETPYQLLRVLLRPDESGCEACGIQYRDDLTLNDQTVTNLTYAGTGLIPGTYDPEPRPVEVCGCGENSPPSGWESVHVGDVSTPAAHRDESGMVLCSESIGYGEDSLNLLTHPATEGRSGFSYSFDVEVDPGGLGGIDIRPRTDNKVQVDPEPENDIEAIGDYNPTRGPYLARDGAYFRISLLNTGSPFVAAGHRLTNGGEAVTIDAQPAALRTTLHVLLDRGILTASYATDGSFEEILSLDVRGTNLDVPAYRIHLAQASFVASGPASARFQEIVVDPPRGRQLPGDVNNDRRLDISDGISLLSLMFLGLQENSLPCGPDLNSPGNRQAIDFNGDDNVDLSDAVSIFSFLFLGGPPHAFGRDCAQIVGCDDNCAQ